MLGAIHPACPYIVFNSLKWDIQMNSSMIPFNKPSIVGQELEYLQDAIKRGQLSGDGYYTRMCSQKLVELTTAPTALLTHSCTAALEMAAILCNLKIGDEVIMPSFTFVSTANAVALRGATPVFVDIDSETLNIDPACVKRAITSKTKAIFAVHYAGFSADMDALAAIARSHNLILVEDAAQALGSTYNGQPCGSLGDMAAFSFHETKNVISGEGGALTINNPEFVERAEIIREKGTNRSRFLRGQVDKYTWVDIGSSFLPGELIAAFIYAQLEHEAEIKARRLTQYDRYLEAFDDMAGENRIRLPQTPAKAAGNGHMFYLLMQDDEDRDNFILHMRAAGVITPFHYVPLHSSHGGEAYARADGDLPVTDDVSARLIRMPLFYSLGDEIEAVISAADTYFNT